MAARAKRREQGHTERDQRTEVENRKGMMVWQKNRYIAVS